MEIKDVRLIDANALLEAICKKCPEYDCKPDATDTVSGCLIYDVIASAHTIDAQPVKHGEWIPSEMNAENKESAEIFGIDIETFLSKAAYCSCCGIQQIANGRDKTHKAMIHKAIYRYCPNCGAKMDGDKDG